MLLVLPDQIQDPLFREEKKNEEEGPRSPLTFIRGLDGAELARIRLRESVLKKGFVPEPWLWPRIPFFIFTPGPSKGEYYLLSTYYYVTELGPGWGPRGGQDPISNNLPIYSIWLGVTQQPLYIHHLIWLHLRAVHVPPGIAFFSP